jgi:preprotein translocase subunit SecA
MLKFLGKLLGGNKSEKDVAQIRPIVEKINGFFQQYQTLSNDQLRNKTQEFKQRIKEHLKDIDAEIAAKQADADALPPSEIHVKDEIYKEVDKLKKDRDKKIEEALSEVQAEAFAVVKETARRFTNNTELEATATQLDKDLSVMEYDAL